MTGQTYTLHRSQESLLKALADLGWERNTSADPVASHSGVSTVPVGEADPFALRRGDWYLFLDYTGKASPSLGTATLALRLPGAPEPTWRYGNTNSWDFAQGQSHPEGIDALTTGNRRERILAVAADPATYAWLAAEYEFHANSLRERGRMISEAPAPATDQSAWWSAANDLMDAARALRSANGFTHVREALALAQAEIDELNFLLDGDTADRYAEVVAQHLADTEAHHAKYS